MPTLLAIGAYVVFAVAVLFPQLTRMRSLPDLGDPLFSIWRMGWVHQQLAGDPRGLFDANIFHPERLALTFSDSILLPSLVASPLRLLGLHPVVVYNVLLIGAFVLSASTCFFLVQRLVGCDRSAFVAGLIFGFYPFRFEHYSHLELQMTALVPLAVLYARRYFETGRGRWLLASAAMAAGQLYSSMYFGLFLCLYLTAVLVVWLCQHPVGRLEHARSLAAAACAYVVLAAPLAAPYYQSGGVRTGRAAADVAHFSATPMDYLRAHTRSAAWSGLTPAGRQEERQLFPGATVILLALGGAVASAARARWAFVAAGAVAFDVSLGFNGLLYPWLYEAVLPVRSLRAASRMSMFVGFSLAVLAGFGMQRAIAARSRAARTVMTLAALTGVAIDVWPKLELTSAWPSPPSVYQALSNREPVVLAEFPAGGIPERFPSTPYLYFSLWHWLPMVNGYSGYYPHSFTEILGLLERFPDTATIEMLEERGVTHVTVNCALYRLRGYEARCANTLEAITNHQALQERARSRWQGDLVVLYELRPF